MAQQSELRFRAANKRYRDRSFAQIQSRTVVVVSSATRETTATTRGEISEPNAAGRPPIISGIPYQRLFIRQPALLSGWRILSSCSLASGSGSLAGRQSEFCSSRSWETTSSGRPEAPRVRRRRLQRNLLIGFPAHNECARAPLARSLLRLMDGSQ